MRAQQYVVFPKCLVLVAERDIGKIEEYDTHPGELLGHLPGLFGDGNRSLMITGQQAVDQNLVPSLWCSFSEIGTVLDIRRLEVRPMIGANLIARRITITIDALFDVIADLAGHKRSKLPTEFRRIDLRARDERHHPV